MFDDVPVSLWLSCLKNMFAEIWRVSTTASFSSSTDERVMMYCIILYRHKKSEMFVCGFQQAWGTRRRALADGPFCWQVDFDFLKVLKVEKWTCATFGHQNRAPEVALLQVISAKMELHEALSEAGKLKPVHTTKAWASEAAELRAVRGLHRKSARELRKLSQKPSETFPAFRIGNSESRGLWKRRALIALTALKVERCSHKILWQDRSPLGSLGVGVHVGPQKTWPPIRACSFRT